MGAKMAESNGQTRHPLYTFCPNYTKNELFFPDDLRDVGLRAAMKEQDRPYSKVIKFNADQLSYYGG
jgi:hypothetical protein